jgi:quercetin dioxygenase-like cupin family protein
MIGKKETKTKPYINDANVRTFSKNVNKLELVWHQDKEDRNIEILEGEGWSFQRDNELPVSLKEGDRIFITANQIHRIIKGNTDLKIKING